jgi:hypothetical protein
MTNIPDNVIVQFPISQTHPVIYASTVLYFAPATWKDQYEGPPLVGYREASSPSERATASSKIRMMIHPKKMLSCPPPYMAEISGEPIPYGIAAMARDWNSRAERHVRHLCLATRVRTY